MFLLALSWSQGSMWPDEDMNSKESVKWLHYFPSLSLHCGFYKQPLLQKQAVAFHSGSLFCFVSTTRTHWCSSDPATGSGRQTSETLLVVSHIWWRIRAPEMLIRNDSRRSEQTMGCPTVLITRSNDITISSIQHCSTDAQQGGGGGANGSIPRLSSFHCFLLIIFQSPALW